MELSLTDKEIGQQIYIVRKRQIMLDSDLAYLYGITTYNLNKAVKRNCTYFPSDFIFQLTQDEWNSLISQYGIEKAHRRGGRRTIPYGFTQEGVAMLSSILNSPRAKDVNIAILRSFAKIRHDSETNLNWANKFDDLKMELRNQIASVSDVLQTLTNSVSVLTIAKTAPENSNPHGTPNITAVNNAIYEENQPNFEVIKKELNRNQELIKMAVVSYFELRPDDLLSESRSPSFVFPRQICMYLIREYTSLSYKDIGAIFRRKDHTTVMHACLKIQAGLQNKLPDYCTPLKAIQEWLRIKGMPAAPIK